MQAVPRLGVIQRFVVGHGREGSSMATGVEDAIMEVLFARLAKEGFQTVVARHP